MEKLLNIMRLALIFALISPAYSQSCPPGGVLDVQHQICYQFYSIFEEYLYAEQQCNALGGNLASIPNAYANNLLLEHADDYFASRNATDFWIGLNDLMVPDQWVWTDNSSSNYLNWAPGEPKTGMDCATERMSDGMWVSGLCNIRKPYVCKVSPIWPPTCPPQPSYPVQTCPPTPTCGNGGCWPQCDKEWTLFVPTDSCYKTFFGAKWADADDFCISQGGHLASIHSLSENTFVNVLARTGLKQDDKDHLTWIGLMWNGKNWTWSDQTTFDYVNWSKGRPDDMSKDKCVQTASDRTHHEIITEHEWYESWNNVECGTVMRSYVCKKPSTHV